MDVWADILDGQIDEKIGMKIDETKTPYLRTFHSCSGRLFHSSHYCFAGERDRSAGNSRSWDNKPRSGSASSSSGNGQSRHSARKAPSGPRADRGSPRSSSNNFKAPPYETNERKPNKSNAGVNNNQFPVSNGGFTIKSRSGFGAPSPDTKQMPQPGLRGDRKSNGRTIPSEESTKIDSPSYLTMPLKTTLGFEEEAERVRNRMKHLKEVKPEHTDSRKKQARETKPFLPYTRVPDEPKRGIKAEPVKLETAAIPIALPPFITVSNFSRLIGVRLNDLLKKLDELGYENVDYYQNASLIAMEYGFEPEANDGKRDIFAAAFSEDVSNLPARPPFVTIMGHVDHGKTTILDYLRKSAVAASEHGGITQHIGAFSVKLSTGKQITFLDTPGHAAFLKMRQRGATVTDIIVLVVAADDSVMPQTIEAIKHAQTADVPIIVAINKVDKPGIDIDRVRRDLAQHGVYVESLGGETMEVNVSGLTGQGIPDLEEAVIALSEVLDNRADPNGRVEGWVVESSTKKGRGNTATVVMRQGTAKPGMYVVAGTTYARIRGLRNDSGNLIKSADPGQPVEIDGWKELPEAGDEMLQAESEQHARTVTEYRKAKEQHIKEFNDIDAINAKRKLERQKHMKDIQDMKANKRAGKETSRQFLVDQNSESNGKQQLFVLRGDVSGSVEAIKDSIELIGNELVSCKVIQADVGPPTLSDIEIAEVADATILCFNVKPDRDTSDFASKRKVPILNHTIIYHLLEDVKKQAEALIPEKITQNVIGETAIRAVITITDKNKHQVNVAGCRVTSGVIKRKLNVSVVRDGVSVFDGVLDSMRQGKESILEATKDNECGLTFKDWNDFKVGDTVRFYETVRTRERL